MEKRLGIAKHRKSLPFSQRMESIRENIAAGKEKEEEMRETRRLQDQGAADEVDNSRIASIATELMISKSLSYIDALGEAQEVYKREIEASENTER